MNAQPPASHVRLRLGSPELAHVLAEGRLPGGGAVARPLALERGEVTLTLGAEPGRPASPAVWLSALRAISLTATAAPCLATLLVLDLLNLPIAWLPTVFGLLGAMLLQLGVNLANDVEDHRRLIDLPGGLGGAGVLQKGWLTPRAVKRAALAFFVLGALAGLPALLRAPLPMALVVAVAGLGAVGYSGRRIGLKYRALGDLTVLVLCGPALTLGMGVAASGVLVPALVPLGLCMGLLAVGLLHANNRRDADVDRARAAPSPWPACSGRAARAATSRRSTPGRSWPGSRRPGPGAAAPRRAGAAAHAGADRRAARPSRPDARSRLAAQPARARAAQLHLGCGAGLRRLRRRHLFKTY
ncbi:MAG: prenyltransferase [Myxococcota bacterium]